MTTFPDVKIMSSPLSIGRTEDYFRFGIRYNLRFYRMTFLLATIVVFLFFLAFLFHVLSHQPPLFH
jgi:hypothetical protein